MNDSNGLMTGCKSDISVLQPTAFAAVPLILDRIRNHANKAIANKGPFARAFFEYAIEYKTFWSEWGFCTSIINRFLSLEIQRILGGRVRHITSAGAHLSLDVHIFMKNCSDASIVVGYGATESSGFCTIMTGGYKATDIPHPRGEVVIGGDCISLGYLKNEALTKECFKEEDGTRWFYTGDIAELYPDGTFKIIDRKKNLHKLPHGEYVPLGKIEAEMKTSPYVDNICIIGSNDCDYLVALIVPNEQQLKQLAASKLNKEDLSLRELCEDPDFTKSVTDILRSHGKKRIKK